MADIMKKICRIVVCLSLCVSIALVSMVLPSFALTVEDSFDLIVEAPHKLEYTSGDTTAEVPYQGSSEWVVDSTSGFPNISFPESYYGMTAYSSRFYLQLSPGVLSYDNLTLSWKQKISANPERVYSNVETFCFTIQFAIYTTSVNFTYPETITISYDYLTSSAKRISDSSVKGIALYSYIGSFSENDYSALLDRMTKFHDITASFDFGGQLQGGQVSFSIIPMPCSFSGTYAEAEAFQQATYDVVANNLAPTVQNIASSAEKIIQGQEAIKDSIDKLPSSIVEEQQKAEESKAAEEKEEYENAIDDNTSSILDQITEDTFPIMSITDSIGQLWSSVGSHSRTEGLVFPSIKVPNFGNARTGEVVLSEEYSIDIEGAINALPSYFVIIFRSFFTIVLGWGALKFLIDFIMSLFTPQEKGDNS